MFLHLGSDIVVALNEILYIGDYKSINAVINREFIENAAAQNNILNIATKTPKSYIVTNDKVYLSAIASMTLKKRAGNIFYSEELL